MEIFAQNAGGAVISNEGLLGNYSQANWTSYSGSFVAPANTDHLTIQFEAITAAIPGERQPGEIALRWDCPDASGRQLKPGVYFVRARGPEGAVTRGLALVR